MSVDISVFAYKEKLPSFESFQHSISKVDDKLSVDEEFSILEHEGFVPCTYDGKECGFEYWIDDVNEELLEDWELSAEELSGRDICITFTTRSDYTDLISSALSSSMLCHIADGLTFDDEEELTINAHNCIDFGHNIVTDAKGLIAEEKAREEFLQLLDTDEKKMQCFTEMLGLISEAKVEDVRAFYGYPLLGLVFDNNIVLMAKEWEFLDKDNSIASKTLPETDVERYNQLLEFVGESLEKNSVKTIAKNDADELIVVFANDIVFKALNTKKMFGIDEMWKLKSNGVEFFYEDKKLKCI